MLGGLCNWSVVCDVDLALCRTCCVPVLVVCVVGGFRSCCLRVRLCVLCTVLYACGCVLLRVVRYTCVACVSVSCVWICLCCDSFACVIVICVLLC